LSHMAHLSFGGSTSPLHSAAALALLACADAARSRRVPGVRAGGMTCETRLIKPVPGKSLVHCDTIQAK